MLDGSLARYNNTHSSLGSVLNIFVNRIVEISIIFSFLLYNNNRVLHCYFMLSNILLCITSFLIVAIFNNNQSHKSFYYDIALIEKAEAFIFTNFVC